MTRGVHEENRKQEFKAESLGIISGSRGSSLGERARDLGKQLLSLGNEITPSYAQPVYYLLMFNILL